MELVVAAHDRLWQLQAQRLRPAESQPGLLHCVVGFGD
jgi:hypothetical protein